MTANGAGGDRAHLGGITIAARRLGAFAALNPDEIKVLTALKGRSVCAGVLMDMHASPGSGWLIVSGWCGRLSGGADETRPVTTVLLPGDGFGIGAAPWAGDLMAVRTLTPCILLDAGVIRQIIRLRSPAHARLIEACERACWFEQIYALNQITRLSGLNAYARVAHFFTELFTRLDQVGLAHGNSFDLPIRQQTVADILGLSGIHFNRIVRQMKKDGLAAAPRGVVHIMEPARLARVAGYTVEALAAPD